MHQKQVKSGRVTSIVHETVAAFVAETASSASFITVSYVQMSASGFGAKVYYSVFPKERAQQAADFLRRQERACRDYLRKHSSLRTIPTVRFIRAKEM